MAVAWGCSSSSKGTADDDTSRATSGEDSDADEVSSDEVGSDASGAGDGPGERDDDHVDGSDGDTGETASGDGNDAAGQPDASAPVDDQNPPAPTVDTGTTLPGFVDIVEGDDGSLTILCGGSPCACSDGEDNDGDGLVDGLDSECTGPFDNDEGTFATGVPGDNQDPKWQDCFFDGNSGAGDDGCRYRTECLTGEMGPDEPGCQISDQCRDFCAVLAPPGCDCFGCCEVATDDGEKLHIIVSGTCSMDVIEDEQACPRCQPTDLCANECDECEICIGQTLDDLPASCWPTDSPPDDGAGGSGGMGGTDDPGSGGGGMSGDPGSGGTSGEEPPAQPPPNVCDNGMTACVAASDCAPDEFCSLGCCKRFTTAR